MIVSFTVGNWMSFRDPVSFSMIASRERQHGDRVAKIGKYQARILPVAAIYGGNASGKTNLFKALFFAKNLVVKGTQPDSAIPVEPFKLDPNSKKQPSYFAFELLIDETIYAFSFELTRKAILKENLVIINSTSEKVLYERHDGQIHFHPSLDKDQFLHFAFKGTRDNQLFLTNSVSQKVENFRPVYQWFKESLELVAPDSKFGTFESFFDEDSHLFTTVNKMLHDLDTGISHLGSETIPFDNISIPPGLKSSIQEGIENDEFSVIIKVSNERFIITNKKGEIIAKKLVSFHSGTDGSEEKFDILQESDGSQRVIDLLPGLIELSTVASKKVYVIDELDRSLHTLLIRSLLEAYLNHCTNDSRSQLLFTTHNILLMDQNLLRRDEMWITERNREGSSELISFSEYKDVRYDKDIRKSYLQGRLGGIPKILLRDALSNICTASPLSEE